MPEPLLGNCLVAQSGGPTAVINSSLAGVIAEALNHECIENIFGANNGVLGILNEDLVDLAEESQQTIRGLRHTPASALGTCRYKLRKSSDFDRVLRVFEAHDIRYFFYIGGNDSQDTAHKIGELARERGYDLRVIGIPKTVDNDLVATDHCPGYGSVIKYIATTVKEMACDHEGMGQGDLVSILEVMGRNTGWIAAGAALARRRDALSDPPHLIYVPEVRFDQNRFLADVQRVLSTERFCQIVAAEGLVDLNGNYLSASEKTDAFGHSQLGGVADTLARMVEDGLGVKARTAKLGIAQRAAVHCSSQRDNDEAYMAGRRAVELAISGVTDKMVTLVRGDTDAYTCETGVTDLEEVANGVKPLPTAWIGEDGCSVNYQYLKYAQPLIEGEVQVPYENGTPKYVKLARSRVQRVLEPHTWE